MTDIITSSIEFASVDTFQKVIDSLGDSINKFSITYHFHLITILNSGKECSESDNIEYGKIQKAERRKLYYCFLGDKEWANVSIICNHAFFVFNLGEVLKIRIYQKPISSHMIVCSGWHDITIHDSKDVIDSLWKKIKEIV